MAQLGDLARAKVAPATCCACLRSQGSRGPRAVRRRRSRNCAGLARLGLASEGARCGAEDARGARRPGQCRACAVPRSAAPPPDRAPRRGRASARRARSHALPPASRTVHELVVAGIAIRRLRTNAAHAALASGRARRAQHAGIPALTAEVEDARLILNTPAARLIASGEERPLLLQEVEALLASNAFVVDACRHAVRDGSQVISLATRPVLFALARALAEAWPGDVARDTLDGARIRLEVR